MHPLCFADSEICEENMKILRAGLGDLELFSEEKLRQGACCFYSEDKLWRFFFEINNQEAIVFSGNKEYIQKAIDEFLFYSGFVSCVKDSNGMVLRKTNAVKLELTPIEDIQPSQFYINYAKLENCKSWIKSQEDIKIPVASINGKKIAQDGHTRLKLAENMGFNAVYTYEEDYDAEISLFADEATKRGITSVSHMEILSEEEYKIKWNGFCDDFYLNKENV